MHGGIDPGSVVGVMVGGAVWKVVNAAAVRNAVQNGMGRAQGGMPPRPREGGRVAVAGTQDIVRSRAVCPEEVVLPAPTMFTSVFVEVPIYARPPKCLQALTCSRERLILPAGWGQEGCGWG